MLRRPILSLVLTAILLLALAAPSAAAAVRGPLPPNLGSLWGQTWQWLTVAFPGLDVGQRGPWSREGGFVDPNGRSTTSSTPSGLRAVWGKEGPAVDPDGKPKATATTPGPGHS